MKDNAMEILRDSLDKLICYARANLGLAEKNVDYVRNGILNMLSVCIAPSDCCYECGDIAALIDGFSRAAANAGVLDDSRAESVCDFVMGELSLMPQALEERFAEIERRDGASAATDMFYDYCVANNYVKKALLDKNPRFDADNGLTITINKAKPEFRDAKKAAAGNAVDGGYPLCSICHENEGFIGRSKRTLRTVDVTLGGDRFFWQYSPYGYFNHHGIAVNYEHTPMRVDGKTFGRLLDFVDRFPHYFLGSNAALPRIGGSVLAHDHYQGGGERLPLHNAKAAQSFTDKKCGATIEILDWAGTAFRVVSRDRGSVVELSERVRAAWENFDAPELGIIHADGDGIHNAISPTALKTSRGYEMNIILRSNITSEQYPDGVFHAHPEFHAIKKESIGLIEAQGLFILPGRLENELDEIAELLRLGKPLTESLGGFASIFAELKALIGGSVDKAVIDRAIKTELGSVCKRILENTAVFKDGAQAVKFLKDRVLK